MLLLRVLIVAWALANPIHAAFRWVVCYSDKPAAEEFRDFQLLVFDNDAHPSLELLARRRADLLGYLSLGEVANHRSYFQALKAEGILLGANPNWPGSFYVDFRDERWRRRVVEQLVPAILAAGFNGVFLDTLDDAAAWEEADPRKFQGMSAAAADLVGAIRTAFPRTRIMVNRGYAILPQIARFIDVLLGESVYSTYDGTSKRYIRVPAQQYEQQVRSMKQALAWNSKLRLCSLDYWDPSDSREIRRIYQLERTNGFEPYVATRELDQVVRAP